MHGFSLVGLLVLILIRVTLQIPNGEQNQIGMSFTDIHLHLMQNC